jgi:thiamine monophosphate synthase
MLGPDALVGVSGYADEERVRGLDPREVDYLGLSSPWPSATKEKPAPDEDTFRRLVAACPVPVYGIGAVTPGRVPSLLAAGCHGVAAIGAIFGTSDPAAAVGAFRAALR